MNYKKYEGRELDFFEGNRKESVVVDNCDYDIGITISFAKDRESHLVCLNGPSAPDYDAYEIEEDVYKRYFDRLLTQIILYKIDGNNLDKFWQDITGDLGLGGMTECAFS